MNYKELYEQEKKRADLLQYDLDRADESHFDELFELHQLIYQLKLKTLH